MTAKPPSIKAIRNEADYDAALRRIEALMDAEPGTPEGDELDVRTDLVEHYEEKHVPIAGTNTARHRCVRCGLQWEGASDPNICGDCLRAAQRADTKLARIQEQLEALLRMRVVCSSGQTPSRPVCDERVEYFVRQTLALCAGSEATR